ncbi:calcium/proton exchanger [Tanacetum coccineum]
MLDKKAHEWLVERNPNSWCRAYFEMDRCSAAFENGISESFNSRILGARGKPIITMLEDIRVFLMQRMWCMNKLAFENKDSITQSVRRQMEFNKKIQSHWLVFPSGYREVEVRRGDQSFGVNLHTMTCVCNMWQLSGIPCIHAMVRYMHMKMNTYLGVDEWYS